MRSDNTFEFVAFNDGSGALIIGRNLRISAEEAIAKSGGIGDNPDLFKALKTTINMANQLLSPKGIYRWVDTSVMEHQEIHLSLKESPRSARLRLGSCFRFLEGASQLLVGIYTVGKEFELAGLAAEDGNALHSYFFDMIGLVALDKLQLIMTNIAEQQACARGWGVSPFLSPGSVHGWDLAQQAELGKMLDFDQIDVEIQENGVLLPFKSISFAIGIGPHYHRNRVGDTCEVCSKREDCQLRKGS